MRPLGICATSVHQLISDLQYLTVTLLVCMGVAGLEKPLHIDLL